MSAKQRKCWIAKVRVNSTDKDIVGYTRTKDTKGGRNQNMIMFSSIFLQYSSNVVPPFTVSYSSTTTELQQKNEVFLPSVYPWKLGRKIIPYQTTELDKAHQINWLQTQSGTRCMAHVYNNVHWLSHKYIKEWEKTWQAMNNWIKGEWRKNRMYISYSILKKFNAMQQKY